MPWLIGGEKIRRAADALAAALTELHGVQCHVKIGSGCSFVMVIKDLSDEARAGQ